MSVNVRQLCVVALSELVDSVAVEGEGVPVRHIVYDGSRCDELECGARCEKSAQEVVEEDRTFLSVFVLCIRLVCRVKGRCAHHADYLACLPVVDSHRAGAPRQGLVCRAVSVRIYGESDLLSVGGGVVCSVYYVVANELALESGYSAGRNIALWVTYRVDSRDSGLIVVVIHKAILRCMLHRVNLCVAHPPVQPCKNPNCDNAKSLDNY